eukprot:TRINITY_DN19909_c3_g1_i1.p1 TRINITY_DN19909_c3_g1~~TRINITY_DN19909_c3_g1_i1.p1  ORF type:complete len:114 (-),score=11.69 TRINITY_DN19909_c3_g1_i1:252-593(-)
MKIILSILDFFPLFFCFYKRLELTHSQTLHSAPNQLSNNLGQAVWILDVVPTDGFIGMGKTKSLGLALKDSRFIESILVVPPFSRAHPDGFQEIKWGCNGYDLFDHMVLMGVF